MVSAEVPVFFCGFPWGEEKKMKEKRHDHWTGAHSGRLHPGGAQDVGAGPAAHVRHVWGPRCLVPILVQSYGLPLSTQTTLFFAGFGTLFFHLCTKLEIPAFLGSSFAFLGGFSAMANLDTGKYAMAPRREAPVRLRRHCGGGAALCDPGPGGQGGGVHRVMRFLPRWSQAPSSFSSG